MAEGAPVFTLVQVPCTYTPDALCWMVLDEDTGEDSGVFISLETAALEAWRRTQSLQRKRTMVTEASKQPILTEEGKQLAVFVLNQYFTDGHPVASVANLHYFTTNHIVRCLQAALDSGHLNEAGVALAEQTKAYYESLPGGKKKAG